MYNLTNMPNIGKALAQRMAAADIKSAEDLRRMGAKQAFLRIHSAYPDSCINSLYALEGAVRGIRWHNLPQETKMELKAFFDTIPH